MFIFETYSLPLHETGRFIHLVKSLLVSFCTLAILVLSSPQTLGLISIPRYSNPESDQEKGETDGQEVSSLKPIGSAHNLSKLNLQPDSEPKFFIIDINTGKDVSGFKMKRSTSSAYKTKGLFLRQIFTIKILKSQRH